jgi:apolipoprotein N-acyltransferase
MYFGNFFVLLASGVIYGLAWRSHELGPIGLIGLALLFFQQAQTVRWWTALLTSLFAGLVAYSIACSWFGHTINYLAGEEGNFGFWVAPIACLIQAGHFGLFGIAWFVARKYLSWGWILAPLIWISVEEIGPGFFPCKAGNLLVESMALSQIASLGGASLVSFQAAVMAGLLTLIAATSWQGMKTGRWRPDWIRVLGFGAAAILFSYWIGLDRYTELNQALKKIQSEKNLRVLIAQIDTEDVNSLSRLTASCDQFRGKTDLFVWPECSLGAYHQDATDLMKNVEYTDPSGLTDSYSRPYPDPSAPLLAAGDSWLPNPDAADSRTNFVSAFLINEQEQIIGRHDKVHLMPYGESIPGETFFPPLRDWLGGKRKISQGPRFEPIGSVRGVNIGAVLCCEDMQPEACRQLVANGADIIVTLGSGAAFDSVVPLRQHFRIAQLRAIENKKYFLRCTSRGISGLVSPSGQVIGELPTLTDVVTPLEIACHSMSPTIFTRWGTGAGYFFAILFTIAGAFLTRQNRLPTQTRRKNPR